MTGNPESAELVTLNEAARMLGVTRQRVQQLVDEGRLRAMRTAHHVYVERASIVGRIEDAGLAEEWMSTAQVAARFDVSPKTVRRWAEMGRLSAHAPFGRALRFDPAEVMRFRPPLLDRLGREKSRGTPRPKKGTR